MCIDVIWPYQRATRTGVSVLTSANTRLDSTSAGDATLGPGAPRDPGHRNGTQVFLITQSESQTHGTESHTGRLKQALTHRWRLLNLTFPLGPGPRTLALRVGVLDCYRTAAEPQSRCHSWCCTRPRRTTESNLHFWTDRSSVTHTLHSKIMLQNRKLFFSQVLLQLQFENLLSTLSEQG